MLAGMRKPGVVPGRISRRRAWFSQFTTSTGRNLKPEWGRRTGQKGGLPAALFRQGISTLRGDACASLRLSAGGGGGGSFVQDAVMDREQCQFQPIRDPDFVVDVAQVILDHLLGGPKL